MEGSCDAGVWADMWESAIKKERSSYEYGIKPTSSSKWSKNIHIRAGRTTVTGGNCETGSVAGAWLPRHPFHSGLVQEQGGIRYIPYLGWPSQKYPVTTSKTFPRQSTRDSLIRIFFPAWWRALPCFIPQRRSFESIST